MLAFAWVKGTLIGSGAWHAGSALVDDGETLAERASVARTLLSELGD